MPFDPSAPAEGLTERPVTAPPAESPSAPQPQDLDSPWSLAPDDHRQWRVRTGHYQVNCRLVSRPGARHLCVVFHGARHNTRAVRPLLLQPAWARQVPVHLLSISDPTTERVWPGALPRASLFIGTLEHDLADELNALIDKAALELGVAPEHTVLYGPSSGGAAALLVGSRRPVGRIVAANAMAQFDALPRRLVERAFEGLGCSPAAVAAERQRQPWRFDPLAAWQHGLAQGHDLRLVISQGRGDRRTVSSHFPALCQAVGLSGLAGGVSEDGRALALLHREPDHGGEPPADLIRAALAAFDIAPDELPTRPLPHGPAQGYEWSDSREEDDTSWLRQPPQALAPAASTGVLLLSGPPSPATRWLRQVLLGSPAVALGLERYRWRMRTATRLSEALFTPERLRRYELGDAPPPDAPGDLLDGMPDDLSRVRWLGDKLQDLHWRYDEVLTALPSARVVFLALDAATALQTHVDGRPDPSLSATETQARLDDWKHQVRHTARALARHGDRILVVTHEQLMQGSEALQPLLDWLSIKLTPRLQQRLRRYREALAGAASQPAHAPAELDRLGPADLAAWQSVLAHARRTVPPRAARSTPGPTAIAAPLTPLTP